MKNQFKRIIQNVIFTFNMLLKASKSNFIYYWLISLVMGVLPFAKLLIWRNVINILTSGQLYASRNLRKLLFMSLAYFIMILFIDSVAKLKDIISYKYNDEIDFYIDSMIVNDISNMELSIFDSSDFKDKVHIMTSTYNVIAKNIPAVVFEIIEMLIWLLIALISVSKISLLLPLILIVLSIPCILGNKQIEKNQYEYRKTNANSERKMNYFQSVFWGKTLVEIKLYDLREYFFEKYKNNWNVVQKAKINLTVKNCIVQTISAVMVLFGTIIIYLFCIAKLTLRIIGVGDVTYYISIFDDFRWKFVGFFSNITDLLNLTNELSDIRKLKIETAPDNNGGSLVINGIDEISFDHVWFKYPNSDNYVLKDCSFTINMGKSYALVGENGAGKSTIIKLLLRLYHPSKGKILLNGTDIFEYNISDYRKVFGTLFQDFVKYSMTLKYNICLSDITNISDFQRLTAAAKTAKVVDFVNGWEKGFDENLTRMFDKEGKELSGGQWQRIALARTLFKSASIFIYDEPFSSLDPYAERNIYSSMQLKNKKKCTIIISHRLSFAKNCDAIYVLKNGKVVEKGTFIELIKKNNEFGRMYNLQAQKYI